MLSKINLIHVKKPNLHFVFHFLACTVFALDAVATELPPEVTAALQKAKVPLDAVSVVLTEVNPSAKPVLSLRANTPMNPASVMKLVTTSAALDLLGPAYTWRTSVFFDGPVREGTLQGNLYVQGHGDPQLVLERVWLLLRRVQGMGVRRIAGDIVLDNSAFALEPIDPSGFDGEAQRPYNAAPDALLINFKSVVITFTPDASRKLATVQYDPPLFGVDMQPTVALSATDAANCDDYRPMLKAEFDNPQHLRFAGSFPPNCGEKVWPIAYADAASYAPRALQGMWLDMGGKLNGSARYGRAGTELLLRGAAFEVQSPPLAEIIRSINKFSNNVMAQQIFLTLGLDAQSSQPSGFATSRAAVQRWWTDRLGGDNAPVLENGSGLSRQERIRADALAKLLQFDWRAPYMPELASSLPLFGVDGTLKKLKAVPDGSAHLKTGTLRDVLALAGYVTARSGKQYVLVAFINNSNASAARPAMQALTTWAIREN